VPVSLEVRPVNDPPTATAPLLEGSEDNVLRGKISASDVDGDVLRIRLKDRPRKGAVTLDEVTGELEYAPQLHFFGDDRFSVEVNDGKVPVVIQVGVKVAAVNDPPIAEAVEWRLREDETQELSLRATDPDNDVLTWRIETLPPRGQLALVDEQQGRVRFTPAKNDNETVIFRMAVSDGSASVVVPVTVLITPVNDLPEVSNLRLETREDVAVNGQLEARDVDGDTLAFFLKRTAKFGAVELDAASGRVRYRPDDDRNGLDSFTVTVKDGKSEVDTMVEVEVAAMNDPPKAASVQARSPEDTPWESTLTATDPEGDPLRWSVAKPPVAGTLEVLEPSRGRVRFLPPENFAGPVDLSLAVTDGELTTPVVVSLDITPVNDAPVATSAEVDTVEDQPVEGSMQGADIENDPLLFRISSPARYGTVEVIDAITGRYRYTPVPDFHGEDSFSFDVSDTKAANRGQVRLRVAPRNDAPTVVPIALRTAEDTPARGRIQASDVDKDKLRYRVRENPRRANLVLDEDSGAFVYTPSLNENGEDAFDIVVSDGTAEVLTTVAVEILRVPDPPVFRDVVLPAREDEELVVDVPAEDPDGDRLTYRLLSNANLGEVTLRSETGPLVYIPRADLHGRDEIQVEASDGRSKVRGTVRLEIQPVNDAPRVAPLGLTVDEDGAVTGRLQGEDVDGDRLRFRVHSPPTLGEVTFDAQDPALLVYRPAKDQDEDVTFSVVAFDGVTSSEPAVVSVHVERSNDAPVAVAARVVAQEDVPLSIQLQGRDPDGDRLRFEVVRPPARGTLELEDHDLGRVLFTPEKDIYGKDSFSFRVRDPDGLESTAMVRITVEPVDDRPIAIADATEAPRFGRVTRRLNGYDPEGNAVTFRIVKQPRGGRVTLDDATTGGYTFAADADAPSRVAFEFVVNDGALDSAPAVVEIRLR
ncbi:MAG: tandem-95 repeat protein, partial [Myxococcota bacterium]